MKFRICCLLLAVMLQNAFGQTKIQGYLADSAHNIVLRSASVSVYEQDKKTVEKVTLTDRFGKFTVDQLAHGKTYRLEFTHQGYEKLTREFSLAKDQKLDFGKLHLQYQATEIEEIVVLPPVRMNGDTIEFNADAFQLDTHAVIEDLIHKLPGMILWGDGKITYNGREIPTVLVNGKEFFGSDRSIALQNIAKEAVKKLQVYDTRDKLSQKQSPLDPQYEMNVVLKEGKEKMAFGNATAGAGTDRRLESYLNMNYADKRTQSSLGYTVNNTNKKLNNLEQLLKNTTYKGVGIHADYQSDFNRTGINRQNALAARYAHDFLGTNETNRKNILTANVFSNRDRDIVTHTAHTVVANNNPDRANTRDQQSESLAENKNRRGDVQYSRITEAKGRPVRLHAGFGLSAFDQDVDRSSVTQYDYSNNRSSTARQDHGQTANTSATASFSANWDPINPVYAYQKGKKPTLTDRMGYALAWNGSISEDRSQDNSSTRFENHIYPAENRQIDRVYENGRSGNAQQIDFTVSHQNIRIANSFRYDYAKTDREVADMDEGHRRTNGSLTHLSRFGQQTYTPNIAYSYTVLHRNYTGRFSESIKLRPELAVRLLGRNNVSTLDYRNIKDNFVSYLPKMDLEYDYGKYGVYFFTSRIGYRYSEDVPAIDRLRPIYDDSNPSYRYFGNPDLSPTGRHRFEGMARFQEHKPQSLMVNYNASYNLLRNAARDSIVFAPGRQQVYAVNIPKGAGHVDMRIHISKPFVIRNNQTFTFSVDAASYWSKNYQYIDSEPQELAPTHQTLHFSGYYTHTDRYQIGWKAGYDRHNSRNLTAPAHTFRSREYNTGISISYAATRKMKIGSNAEGRFILSDRTEDRLAIWNANIAHRFAKGNDFEAKLTVYDILNQNKGFYVHNSPAEFTNGHQNNLNRFFLFSVSYFPRKFGL